jgi:prephenate dehydratase/chorismate mutase
MAQRAQKAEKTRKRINALDREFVQMMETRVELSLRLAGLEAIDAAEEVEKVSSGLEERCAGLITVDFVREIYRRILNESDHLQKSQTRLVGFQGEHGAYGEVASRMLVPGAAYMPCMEFVDVFDGVENGLFTLGVVPVENSLEGAVTQVNDLLTTTKLKVVGEVKVPIHHCLLAPAGTKLEDIRIVYSHPQALAQCRQFILKHRFEARPFYDTAGAAKMIDRERPLAVAAIASELCSKLYGMSIIERGIEDADSNSTRFQLIAKAPFEGRGEKCSVIFAVKDEAGALQSVLTLFAEADINLTRIASTPRRGDPGNYTFFLDFEGWDTDPKIRSVLHEVALRTKEMLFLGCYPKWNPTS